MPDERALTAAREIVHISHRQPLLPDLGEAWRRGALAWLLARRNVKVRFTQTLLGRAWIVIQPLALTGVVSLVFGGLLALPSEGVPYVVFAFTGMALWTLIQRALTEASMSLATAAPLLSKVYFPRILIPLSTMMTAALDFVPVYVCGVLVVALYGLFPGWPILLSPLVILLALTGVFAVGLWAAAIDGIYRDVRLFVPHVLQLLFYATPVVYSADAVPARWQHLYALNPLAPVFRAFRWTMIAGAEPPSLGQLAWVVGFTVLLLVTGLVLFARLERIVVDRL